MPNGEEMINRLRPYVGEPDGNEPDEDYWDVGCENAWYYVSRETAAEIERQLRRLRPPRWLRFRDLFGSEVCVRSDDIKSVRECTNAQRSAERDFRRARRKEEEKERRPWEDDE